MDTFEPFIFLLLSIHISTTTPSVLVDGIIRKDSILTLPGKECPLMNETMDKQLNYKLLKDKCSNFENKEFFRLKSTFDDIDTKFFYDLPQFEDFEAKDLNFSKISLSSSNLKTIDISHNKLKSFRIFIQENLEGLNLSHNKLSLIEFSPVDKNEINIKILDLSYNTLSTVNAISNLTSLKYLNLKNNNVNYIKENSLAELKDLVILNLSFNKLSNLYPCTFCFSRNLENLDLSHNNLRNIKGLLDPLIKLKYLDLDGNKIIKFEYKGMFQKHPKLEKFIFNSNFFSTNIARGNFNKRSVSNSHFHVAVNNKKMFHNVSSISRKSNLTDFVNENSSVPLKDFFEKLHSLNVDNIRSFLNVTFAKVDSSVAKLDHKYGKILEKLDLILSQLNFKLESVNETLSDMVLEISNINSESGDILNATVNEVVPRTSLLISDYEELEYLLTICVFLLLILVCLTLFKTVLMIRKNRRLKKYRMNLLNLETVP